jgi:hypothetical protein
MKKLLLIITLFLSAKAYAQKDVCKDIVATGNELSGDKKFKTPVKFNMPQVSIEKTISDKGELTFVSFLIYADHSFANQKGLFIKFDDGTILKIPESYIASSYSTISHQYVGSASLSVSDENEKSFMLHKIVKYQVGDVEKEFPEKWQDRYLQYYNCIKSSK